MTTKSELSWLAGLLEGEGWFGLQAGKYPAMAVVMTDEDVMAHAAKVIGGRLNGPYQFKGNKPRWTCQVNGCFAVFWMKKLRPLLGVRRQAQIDKALAAYANGYKENRDPRLKFRAKRGSFTPASCHPEKPVTGSGLCKSCYMKKKRAAQ